MSSTWHLAALESSYIADISNSIKIPLFNWYWLTWDLEFIFHISGTKQALEDFPKLWIFLLNCIFYGRDINSFWITPYFEVPYEHKHTLEWNSQVKLNYCINCIVYGEMWQLWTALANKTKLINKGVIIPSIFMGRPVQYIKRDHKKMEHKLTFLVPPCTNTIIYKIKYHFITKFIICKTNIHQ